jgi:hypothetical protein
MGNAYVCENIDDIKYLFQNFDGVNNTYTSPESFVNDFMYERLVIFFEYDGRWAWDYKYDIDVEYNYISIKNISRKEKLNRILNYG